MPPEPPEATAEQVRQACTGCHAYPPPESFPRSAWRKEVKQGTIHAARFSDIRFDREFSLVHFRPHTRTRGASAFLEFVKQFPFAALIGGSRP